MILLFGSENCTKCAYQKVTIETSGLLDRHEFSYIDAFDDDMQEMCDSFGIDEIPHLMIFDGEDELVYEKIGYTTLNTLRKILTNATR
jgi:hypothetical protein